ncbi:MAG: hypothetical protein U0236_14055 [Nitrospira sp.]
MPERFNVCLFLDRAPRPAQRQAFIGECFHIFENWLVVPTTVSIYNCKTSGEIYEAWSLTSPMLTRGLGDHEIIFVYSPAPIEVTSGSRNSLSIEEFRGKAIYTVSVTKAEIELNTCARIEDMLIRLHVFASDLSKCFVAAGLELELVSDDKPLIEVAASFFKAPSTVDWFIGSRTLVPATQNSFEVVWENASDVLMRHHRILFRLSLK